MNILLMVLVAATAQDSTKTASDHKREVLNKLESMKVDIDETDKPLEDVINFFRELTGVNFFIDPRIYGKVPKDQMKVTIKLKDVRVKSALKLVLEQYELHAIYRDGIIHIVTKDEVNQNVETRMIDVKDMFMKINNFPGPHLELTGGEGSAGAPGITFQIEEPAPAKLDQGFLEEMIKSNTGGKTWEENPNAAIRITPTGVLIVTQTKAVHKEIENLINLLRQYK